MIKIRRLIYTKEKQNILNIKSLAFTHAGLYVILGDSGSGKTTLLHAISGFLSSYDGDVIVDNRNVNKMDEEEHAQLLRTKVSVAFQHSVFINDLTVHENIGLVLDSFHEQNSSRNKKVVEDIAQNLGITSLLDKKVRVLSGGEKARVNVARTLIRNTSIYLFDEPTAMLDETNNLLIMNLLKEKSKTAIVIVVTHDTKLAEQFADKVITLAYGEVVSEEEINNLPNKVLGRRSNINLNKNSEKISSSLFKTWRKRNFIASFSANFGLTGIGLTILLVSSLNTKLISAMKGTFNEHTTFAASNVHPDTNVIKTLDESDELHLTRNYNFSLGSFFLTDFDDVFTAVNEVKFYHNNYRHVLPSFHANLFNEVLFFEEIEDSTFPYIGQLASDEVVLDLPIDDFRVLLTAFNLPYKNNASDLGYYLEHNDVNIILNVANYDWGYFDEQIFRLKAVRLKSNARVIAQDFKFAEQLFIQKMKLLSSTSLTKVEEYPWVLKKLAFVFTKNRDKILFQTEKFPSYIFQTANRTYFRALNEQKFLHNRVLVFKAPPKFYDVFEFIKKNEIRENYLYTTPYFTFLEELLLIGFSMNFFVSNDAILLAQVAREDILNKETSHVQLTVPDNVINLSMQNSGFGSLSFKSIDNSLKLDEIVISSAAALKIFGKEDIRNEVLHVQALTEITNKDALYDKHYEALALKVVGITPNENVAFYHHPLWFYLLFKDVFNISPFGYKINGVVIDDNVSIKDDNDLTVTKPFMIYNKLINEALANIQKYSLFVSLTAFVVSFFIVIMVLFYLLSEAYPSLNNLRLIGYNKKSIQNIVTLYVITFFLKLYLMIVFELLFFSFIIEFLLSRYFLTKFSYVFTVTPYVLISVLITVLILIVSVLFRFLLNKNEPLTFSRRDL